MHIWCNGVKIVWLLMQEAVHQLVENLQLGGQHAGTAANRALSDIIAAYVSKL